MAEQISYPSGPASAFSGHARELRPVCLDKCPVCQRDLAYAGDFSSGKAQGTIMACGNCGYRREVYDNCACYEFVGDNPACLVHGGQNAH